MTETGTVTAISVDRFGFIAPDQHAGEIWIRPRSMDADTQLHIGQRVEYVLALGALGVEAANVRPLDACLARLVRGPEWAQMGTNDDMTATTVVEADTASAEKVAG
jgi:cold shock CspA family protein